MIIIRPPAVETFVPMGMNKNGTQSITNGSSNVKVTSWTARSGYADTVITDNELISAGGASVLINARIQLTSALTFGSTFTMMLMKNDTQLTSTSGGQGTSVFSISNYSTSLSDQDRVWLRVSLSGSFSSTIQTGSTATYLYFEEDV